MSKTFLATLFVALAAVPLGNALADGSAEAGKAKSTVCAACHGPDGNSVNPEWPSLAGQHPVYTAAQLQHFKNGERQNPLMSPQAAPLSAEDMADLAAYFAAQTMTPKEANQDLFTRGQKLYRGGDEARGITACIACHGPDGKGNPVAGYPVVAGQHAVYLANQLRAYASGDRETDPNQMMRSIARRMTENDIKAVSSYMQGLR